MWRSKAAEGLAAEFGLDPEKLLKWLEYSGISDELRKLDAARNHAKERARRLREAAKTNTKVPFPQAPNLPNSPQSCIPVNDTNESNAHLHSYVHRSAHPPRWFFDTFNKICTRLPKAQVMTKKREVAARQRLHEYSPEEIEEAFAKANVSPFCTGENDRKWVATVDFFLRPDSIQYTLEGRYDDRKKGSAASSRPRGAAYQSHAGPDLGALRAAAEATARGDCGGAVLPDGSGSGEGAGQEGDHEDHA